MSAWRLLATGQVWADDPPETIGSRPELAGEARSIVLAVAWRTLVKASAGCGALAAGALLVHGPWRVLFGVLAALSGLIAGIGGVWLLAAPRRLVALGLAPADADAAPAAPTTP